MRKNRLIYSTNSTRWETKPQQATPNTQIGQPSSQDKTRAIMHLQCDTIKFESRTSNVLPLKGLLATKTNNPQGHQEWPILKIPGSDI